MKLSPEEKATILKIRAEQESFKPIKIGFLKENYYLFERENFALVRNFISKVISESEKEVFLKKINDFFKEPLIPAGTKCECYKEEDGPELWSDTFNGAIECRDNFWASKNLDGIQDLRKKKK